MISFPQIYWQNIIHLVTIKIYIHSSHKLSTNSTKKDIKEIYFEENMMNFTDWKFLSFFLKMQITRSIEKAHFKYFWTLIKKNSDAVEVHFKHTSGGFYKF